ncbi:MAG: sugar phosphate isomerase/epimerase [Thermoguttaceae bacterium]|jgi:sugar phosphate isomerase/epimerase|nr:sugar phosphate isomerase/epimerase [Thermoguttaceae bacterium]
MPDRPRVILSGFADEAANQKTAVQQFAAFAALGLQYYSIRFVDVLGTGEIKNVMKLSRTEIHKVRRLQDEYGLNVSSIGSPIGKVKLLDVDDGTKNTYVPFKRYLEKEVKRACQIAHALETKLIRGFSFYHPRGTDPQAHLPQVVDQLGQIAETCHRSDLTFGLEVEANLVGGNGYLLAEIHRQVNHPAMVLVFDAANLIVQGYSSAEVLDQFRAMLPGLGWLHIKDYHNPRPVEKGAPIDEDILHNFVPADQGDAAHEAIFREFRAVLPDLRARLHRRGIPGVFLDLEPHVKGGGQFGGFSGPDGMGVALRALCKVLDYVGIEYHLRDFDDIKAARGF